MGGNEASQRHSKSPSNGFMFWSYTPLGIYQLSYTIYEIPKIREICIAVDEVGYLRHLAL